MAAPISNFPRVAYYLERYLPASEAFIAKQAGALRRYDVSFIASSRVQSPSVNLVDAPVFDISAHLPARMGAVALKLARFAVPRAIPPVLDADLVHAHFGKNGYVALPLVRAVGKPLVTTFHGFDATYVGDPRTPGGFNQVRFFRYGRAWMARQPAWTVAVSRFVARNLEALGFPSSRMLLNYVGIDLTQFQPSQHDKRLPSRIISVARFVEYKGHKYIIDAISKLAKSGIDVELVMVGQGPLRDAIDSYARMTIPRFKIIDSLSQREIAEMMATSSIYVHGSIALQNGHAEAFGLANLEAQAVGTPVVAFDSGGVGEAVISGATGEIVPERDTEAMAAAIAALLRDEDRRRAYGKAAVAMVRDRFDISRQAALLEDFYDEVIRSHARQGWY